MSEVNLSMWNYIVERISSLPKSSPVPRMLLTYLRQREFESRAFCLRVEDKALRVGESRLDLGKRKKMLILFNSFLTSKDHQVSREDLIYRVYGQDVGSISERQLECLQHNIVKLVSRARIVLKTSIPSVEGTPVDWFPYDPERGKWSLYRIKREHYCL